MGLVKELSYTPASERRSKLFEHPVKVQCDLITDMCMRENLQWVFNMQTDQINQFEQDIRREENASEYIYRDQAQEMKA